MAVRFSTRFYFIWSVAALLLAAAGGVMYVAFSGDESARSLRARFIGLIADPPKKVAENLMTAAQNGDSEKFFALFSRNARARFLNKCALDKPDRPVQASLNEYADALKLKLTGARFEFEPPKNDVVNDKLVIVPVRILYEKQPPLQMDLRIVSEPDGYWKCDNRL